MCDFFEDADGNNTIYYVCAFEDRAARDNAFDAFRQDEEWTKVFEASRTDGPLVNKVESFFMNRVPYIKADWK